MLQRAVMIILLLAVTIASRETTADLASLRVGTPPDIAVLESPVAPTDEAQQRGKARYEKLCAIYHGKRGDGRGLVTSNDSTDKGRLFMFLGY